MLALIFLLIALMLALLPFSKRPFTLGLWFACLVLTAAAFIQHVNTHLNLNL